MENDCAFIFKQSQEDAQQQIREYKEIIKQIEEDEERRILDIQIKYEKKLHTEKEANTNLKGESELVTEKVWKCFLNEQRFPFSSVTTQHM